VLLSALVARLYIDTDRNVGLEHCSCAKADGGVGGAEFYAELLENAGQNEHSFYEGKVGTYADSLACAEWNVSILIGWRLAKSLRIKGLNMAWSRQYIHTYIHKQLERNTQ